MTPEEKNGSPTGTDGEKRHLSSAERQALYADKAARARSASRRAKIKKQTVTVICAAVAALAVAGAAVWFIIYRKNVLGPQRTYDEAVALMDSGDYKKAADLFDSLGGRFDSAEKARECILLRAKQITGLDTPLIADSSTSPWFSIDEEGNISFDKDVYKGPDVIEIPAVFDGEAVRGIGARMFFYCDFLTGVVIPETVERIGERAFLSCTSLTSVTIPDRVSEIGSNAFAGCTALSEIVFGKGLKTVGDRAFKRCDALTSVVLPEGLERIGPYAFNTCVSLTSVSLPSTLKEVANYAFSGCGSIKEVNFAGDRKTLEALCSGEDGDVILKAENVKTAG